MKELTKTRRLTISTIVFVFVLVIGFLTFRTPNLVYELSPESTIEELYNIENEMIPDEMMDILAYGDSNSVLIDVRDPYEYNKGYLGEAINIPVSEILEEESISFFQEMKQDSVMVILYGNDQLEANGPWMLLRQLGFDNIKILLGGYDYMANEDIDYYDMPEIPLYLVEEPQINFAEFIENASLSSGQMIEQVEEPKQIAPVKRKKKVVAEGGC